jgi:hypothetical protein
MSAAALYEDRKTFNGLINYEEAKTKVPQKTGLLKNKDNILSTAPQLSISQKALGTLPGDGNVMSKHVRATIHN